MQDSEIVLHKGGGASLQGPDAMAYFKAVQLCSFLKLYAKTKIIPTRGVTGPVMLRLAKEFTGKDYKRGQYLQAAEDVRVWIETMKAALPVKDERG